MEALVETLTRLRRATAARHRLQLQIARNGTREWQVKRRERTRHLIELGGLVVKSRLADLADDDRAVMFGLFVEAASALSDERRDNALTQWRRRGKRAFADTALPDDPHPDKGEA